MTNPDKLNVLVFGAGAIGAYFGGRLAQSGCANVAVVCRSDYEAVKQHGFKFNSIDGNFEFMPDGVYRSMTEYPTTPDVLIVSTKVLPNLNTAKMIAPVVGKNTAIVLIQNGLGMEEEMHAAFPHNDLYGVIAYIGVCRIGNGVIDHQGGGRIIIGRYPTGTSPLLQRLIKAWLATKVNCRESDDIIKDRWAKLVWNAPYNPISILAGCVDTGIMSTDSLLNQLCIDVMQEVCDVAKACGKELPNDIIEKNITYTRDFPPYRTSMLADYENGRSLEVEAILGSIVSRAKGKNIPIPRLQTIYALLRSVDKYKK